MGQSREDIYRSLAQMFLPDELLNYFEVAGFREELTGWEIMNGYPEKLLHISLDEKVLKPSEDYRINRFTEEKIVKDFPIRNRQTILHVRRRRWISPEGHNEVLDYGELLGASGTKLSREFALFLKVLIDNNPVTYRQVADVDRLNASTLGNAYIVTSSATLTFGISAAMPPNGPA